MTVWQKFLNAYSKDKDRDKEIIFIIILQCFAFFCVTYLCSSRDKEHVSNWRHSSQQDDPTTTMKRTFLMQILEMARLFITTMTNISMEMVMLDDMGEDGGWH